MVLGGPHVEPRIKAGLTFCKASALTPILSLKFLIFKKRLSVFIEITLIYIPTNSAPEFFILHNSTHISRFQSSFT